MPPYPHELETHGLLGQDMRLWWQAHLKHYGLFFEPYRQVSSMRSHVRRQLARTDRLIIPSHLRQLESQLQQQQTLDEPVRDDGSSTLMTPPITDGDEAIASEHDATFVPVDTKSTANNAQNATPSFSIAQPPPKSAMSRKRKASDFFEPEAKRVASAAVVGPSRELSRCDDADPDDSSISLESSDRGSAGSPSGSRAETPSLEPKRSKSSSSCSSDSDESGTDVEETSSSSQTPPSAWNEDEWLAILQVKARELEEDYLGLKARERTGTATSTTSMTQAPQALITEPDTSVNLSGARGCPTPEQMQTTPETEQCPVEDLPIPEPEQKPAPPIKKHCSATQIYKLPNVPVFTEVDVEYTKRGDFWCAAFAGFAVNERKELFIHDAPWTSSREWDSPIKRASRWLPNDHDMLNFYAQLMHRGLPLTRTHEVAKWRIKTRTIRKRQLLRTDKFKKIVRTLGKFLNAAIDELRQGNIPDGSCARVVDGIVTSAESTLEARQPAVRWWRSYAEYSEDVEPWMEETGPRLLEGMTSYNRVMHKWLDVRSRVPEPVAPPPSPPIKIKIKPDLIPRNCPACHLQLRICECKFCVICGQLTDDCDCVECKLCHEVTDDGACECEECYECSERMDETKKILCECYCQECESLYEYASDNGSTDGCGCRIEWRRTGQYAMEVRAARDARRAKRKAVKDQQQRENYQKNGHVRLQEWIKQHRPGYWQEHRSADTKIDLGDVSGTYQLFSRERMNPCREKQDLSITTKDTLIRGRYRYSEYVNGLFFGGVVPTQASTSVVPCRVAIGDFESQNGDWWYDVAPTNDHEEESPDNTDGIMFLGGGLIKVSPHFFAHVNGRIGNAVFGIKIDDYCEDCGALQESWDAIHNEFATDRRGARGIRKVPLDPECDENLIHDLVDRLWRESDPPSPKDSIAMQFIPRYMREDYGV